MPLFFRALGTFAGGVSVAAAAAVAVNATNALCHATDRLADLVAKSFIAVDVSGAEPRFRLLDTTRAFAIENLDESGERQRIAGRHASYYLDLFERAEREAAARTSGEWLLDFVPEIDNVRRALDWALAPGGQESIGVALTAAAVSLWMRLSLLVECRGRAERALDAFGAGAPAAHTRK